MEQGQTDRSGPDFLGWTTRLAAVGAAGVLVVSALAVWIGTSRGFDLTDEGIYLVTSRAFRRPELTFTGAPGMLGPVFQLLGWSIPWLRRVKLIAFLVMSGVLGTTVERVLIRRIGGRSERDLARLVWVVALVMVGGLTVYSLLPQSPGYNDLAILLSMAAVVVTVRAIADGASIRTGVGLGFFGVLLFFVKFPSAAMVGAGCLTVLVVRRRGAVAILLRTLALGGAVGGVIALGLLQVLSGNVISRAQAVFRANSTAVKGQSLSNSYGDIYLSAAGSILRGVGPLVAVVGVAAVVVRWLVRRAPWAACLTMLAVSLAVVAVARRRQFFTGGQDHVSTLQNAFPLLAAIVVLSAWSLRGPAVEGGVSDDDRRRGDLLAGVALLLAAPTLQAIGTGNTPFVIAASAGALWMSGFLVVLFWLAPLRGPASLASIGLAGLVGGATWLLGAPALWLTPFRLAGDLRDQTTLVRGVPRLSGVHTDPATAAFMTDAHRVLADRRVLGRPGFSSFAGVGLAYALELGHPPAGIYIDEPLAGVLSGRIADACRIGAISPDEPPVVLTDASRFSTTTRALEECGIDFPDGYERVTLASPPFLADFGIARISLWTPKP